MNEALRLAAWLDANAKHMKYDDEQIQMRRAAKELRSLEKEIRANLDALHGAREMLAEMKKMLLEVADGKLPEQTTAGGSKRISVPVLWR